MNKRDLGSLIEYGDDDCIEWMKRLDKIEQSIRILREEADSIAWDIRNCPRDLFYCSKTRKEKTRQNKQKYEGRFDFD